MKNETLKTKIVSKVSINSRIPGIFSNFKLSFDNDLSESFRSKKNIINNIFSRNFTLFDGDITKPPKIQNGISRLKTKKMTDKFDRKIILSNSKIGTQKKQFKNLIKPETRTENNTAFSGSIKQLDYIMKNNMSDKFKDIKKKFKLSPNLSLNENVGISPKTDRTEKNFQYSQFQHFKHSRQTKQLIMKVQNLDEYNIKTSNSILKQNYLYKRTISNISQNNQTRESFILTSRDYEILKEDLPKNRELVAAVKSQNDKNYLPENKAKLLSISDAISKANSNNFLSLQGFFSEKYESNSKKNLENKMVKFYQDNKKKQDKLKINRTHIFNIMKKINNIRTHVSNLDE